MFQWSPATGAVSEDTLFNLAINATETTTYIRQIVNNACVQFDTIDIEVIPVANIEVTPDNPTLCPGESVQLNVTADQPIDSWEWMPSNGLSCDDCTDPVASPPSSITYQVTGEFMGCPSSAQVSVEVSPAPLYTFPNPAVICIGQSIVLNGSVDPNATYEWLDENGNVISTDPQPEVFPTENTSYTLNIANGICPSISDAISVEVIQDFVLTVSEDLTICQEEMVTLSAEPTGTNVFFTWEDENGNTQAGSYLDIPGNTLQPGSSNTYTVTASTPMGCFTYVDEVTVDIFPTSFSLDSVFLNQMDTLNGLYEGAEISLSAFTTPQPIPGGTYEWYFNGSLFSTTSNGESGTFNIPELPGNLLPQDSAYITLNISSADGCAQTWSETFSWINNPVEFPNVFTPNGDGSNDFFSAVSIVPVDVKNIRIWDRWGKMVYNNEDNSGSWDGKEGGNDVLSDVYIYEIQYSIQGADNIYTKRGDVTLLR